MGFSTLKRSRTNDRQKPPKKHKKVKRQAAYHSSSEDGSDNEEEADFAPVNLQDEDGDTSIKEAGLEEEDEEENADDSEASEDSMTDDPEAVPTKRRKRNDPEAFATSISKILGSKLSTSKRGDPVLSRSKGATTNTKGLIDAKLEAKAQHKIREEKREALDRGRVKDVLGVDSTDVNAAEVIELERKLKKTAQRGVIKLFNAVRAAQVKGEEAAREARDKRIVGMGKREEKVTEMSKQGFLDLIAGGGKPKTTAAGT